MCCWHSSWEGFNLKMIDYHLDKHELETHLGIGNWFVAS